MSAIAHKSRKKVWAFPYSLVLALWGFSYRPALADIFGADVAALMKLVAGQITEIERLTEQVGVTKENHALLIELNQGIDKTVSQIQSVETVLQRAQGLNPQAIRSMSELNQYLSRARDAKKSVEDMMGLHTEAASIAIQQSSLQSETAYLMGQEMLATGSVLTRESQFASPGRASQIAAASQSAQMLAQGVQLQTLAQIAQIQTMQLDLMKAQIESQQRERQMSANFFEAQLGKKPSSGGGK